MTEIEELKETLSKHGKVEICKADYVFTLLITGEGLSKSSVHQEIMKAVSDYCRHNYPYVEIMSNSDCYWCIVLKP
jgi:nucleoid-associated protein YejK